MKMVIPIGIFHDDFHLGIDSFGRIHHQLAPSIGHESESVFRPTLATFSCYLVIVLQVDEKEVVENDVVKESGCVFRDMFHLLPFVLSCITVGLEV